MTSPAAQAPAANGRLTSLASQTGALAEKTYVSAKAYVPESVKPRVDQVEGAVAEVAAPYVHKAQDTGGLGRPAGRVRASWLRCQHSGAGGNRRRKLPDTTCLRRCVAAGATLLRAADDRIDTALNTAQKVYSDNSAYLQVCVACSLQA